MIPVSKLRAGQASNVSATSGRSRESIVIRGGGADVGSKREFAPCLHADWLGENQSQQRGQSKDE